MRTRRDVLIAGGGPSGLGAAIEARQRGLSVTVFEPRGSSIDKACGEGLMPAGVRALERWGVAITRFAPFCGIRYVRDGRSIAARFSGAPGMGIRRLQLHEAMRERATTLGVEFLDERVECVEQSLDVVRFNDREGRYGLAADGLRSPLRGLLGVPVQQVDTGRVGLRRHFRVAPWTDLVEVHWGDHAEAYVTPVDAETIGVAFLFERGRFGNDPPWEGLIREFPELAERWRGAESASVLRGAGPFWIRPDRRREGRVLLIGDAAGYVDPITGEGLRLGFASAVAAVDGIANDDPSDYERRWSRLTRRYRWMTGGLVLARRYAWFRASLFPVLGAVPALFRTIVRQLADDG